MELTGTIKARGKLKGSFDFDQANYELLSNKPSINGVELIGNKTTEDLHIQTGGGGTNNYNNLENKPKINGVILQDELSLNSLGIQPEIEYPEDPTKYLDGEGNFTSITPPIFIDTSNIIYQSNTIQTIDYTADQNSYIYLDISSTSNASGFIYIDNKPIARCYTTSNQIITSAGFYVKKGQRITSDISGNIDLWVRVYGLM